MSEPPRKVCDRAYLDAIDMSPGKERDEAIVAACSAQRRAGFKLNEHRRRAAIAAAGRIHQRSLDAQWTEAALRSSATGSTSGWRTHD